MTSSDFASGSDTNSLSTCILNNRDYPLDISKRQDWLVNKCQAHFYTVTNASSYSDGGYVILRGSSLEGQLNVNINDSSRENYAYNIYEADGDRVLFAIYNGPEGERITGRISRDLGRETLWSYFSTIRGGSRCPGNFCSACPTPGVTFPLDQLNQIVDYISSDVSFLRDLTG